MATSFENIIGDLISAFAVLVTLLGRDVVRDKKFKTIRDEQVEHFTCRFTQERAKHVSEIRDTVRDIKKDVE